MNSCYYCRALLKQMKNLKNIFVFPLVLAVLLSTTGITVYQHDCSHTGNTYTSLFTEPTDCCGSDPIEELPPCCSTTDKNTNESSKNDDCCNTEVNTYKIDVPFDLPAKTISKISLKEIMHDNVVQLDEKNEISQDEIIPENKGPSNYKSLPRYILFQQLKIMFSDLQLV